MTKREIKESIKERDYWYDKSILSHDEMNFERYDRPIGGLHMEESNYDTMYNYENHHFID